MDDETIEQLTTTSDSDKPIHTNLPDDSSFHSKSAKEQLLPIFKLNSDCFKNLFDKLALKDLCSLRETCKQFTRIVDFFVEQNYPALKIGCRKIEVCRDDYHFTELDVNSMKVIKKIHWITLNSNIIDKFKDILSNIEMVKLRTFQINGEVYEEFLQFCPNVKHLIIWNLYLKTIMGSGNDWLLRHYPKLEHLELEEPDIGVPGRGREIIELKTFFQLNPNVRVFTTIPCFLHENRNWIKSSNVQIDQLNLKGAFYSRKYMNYIWQFINELYEQGFYKRFHFYGYYYDCNREIIDQDQIFFLHSVEKLHFENRVGENMLQNLIILLPPLQSLRELSLMEFEREDPLPPGTDDFVRYVNMGFRMVSKLFVLTQFEKNLETLARSLTNVERIHVRSAKLNDILPFIRRSAKINEIRIDRLEDDSYFKKQTAIDVVALNNERRKLIGACKLTLYVDEEIFLATKWAARKIKCTLIELKRTYEWPHQTYYRFDLVY